MAATTTGLSLTGAKWRALACCARDEPTHYAMQGAGWLPLPSKGKGWACFKDAASVVASTDGRIALFLPHNAPCPVTTDCLLVSPPKVGASKRARLDESAGLCAPNGSAGHFPPVAHVLPGEGNYAEGYEASTDAWRALLAGSSANELEGTEVVRFRVDTSGAHVGVRSAEHGVESSTTLGGETAPTDPIGLDAALLRKVLKAADLLGAYLVTARTHAGGEARHAVAFDLGGRALAILMPVNLGQ